MVRIIINEQKKLLIFFERLNLDDEIIYECDEELHSDIKADCSTLTGFYHR